MAHVGWHYMLVARSFFVRADQGHSEDMEDKHSMDTLVFMIVLLHLGKLGHAPIENVSGSAFLAPSL